MFYKLFLTSVYENNIKILKYLIKKKTFVESGDNTVLLYYSHVVRL